MLTWMLSNMSKNYLSQEEMLEQWPELGIDTDTSTEVSAMKPILPPVVKEAKPLLCVDCHWVGTTHDRDVHKMRCFVAENYAGINVVDGSRVYLYPLCMDQRDIKNIHPSACGINGRWWKQRELPPIQEVTIGGHAGINLELVVGKKEPKYKVPALKRLSKADLDDI